MCQWFIFLSRLNPFKAAHWRDSGVSTHIQFILGKGLHYSAVKNPGESKELEMKTGVSSTPSVGCSSRKKDLEAPQKRGKPGKGKGREHSSKGQAKQKERPSQQPVSGL